VRSAVGSFVGSADNGRRVLHNYPSGMYDFLLSAVHNSSSISSFHGTSSVGWWQRLRQSVK
jgi:hypothetical protein